MTQKQMEKFVSKWAPRLGLAHWRIEVRYGDPEHMSIQDAGAIVIHMKCRESATILVDPMLKHADGLAGEEHTLLHELMELAMTGMDVVRDDPVRDTAAEQFINRMVRCLLKVTP